MVLAGAQTNSGAKTFLDSTLLLRNVANTFSSKFTNTNTAARTYTLKDADGTLAFLTDVTGIPYTGATSDIDFGAHNLTIDTNLLFVNATSNQVGINTTSFLSTEVGMQINAATGPTILMLKNTGNTNAIWEMRNSNDSVKAGFEIWSGVLGIGAYTTSPIDILITDSQVAR